MKKSEKKTANLLEGEPISPSFSTNAVLQKELNKTKNQISRTIAWILIGGIFIASALVLLFTSFKRNQIGVKEFTPQSIEFIFSCVCFGVGGLFLITGILVTSLLHRKAKKIDQEIHSN